MMGLALLFLLDIIRLKNGEVYEGRVVKRFAGTVQIETANGIVDVDEGDIDKIEEKPWTPPAKPPKKNQPDPRKIPGWPDVQAAPKIDLRAVYRDPFVNFRILFPDSWQFHPVEDRSTYAGKGGGAAVELRIDRKEGDLKAFVSEQVKDKPDAEEDLKIGGLPARRVKTGNLVRLFLDAGPRKFTLSCSGPTDEAEAVMRSLRVFPENEYSDEKKKQYDDLYRTAVNEMNAQNFPAALKELEKLRDLVPNYPEAHSLIYRACTYIQSEYKKGADAMQKASTFDPDNFEYRFYLTRMLLTLRKLGEAEKQATKAVELQPWMEPGWTQLGTACLLQQNYKKAKEAFRRALDIDPKSVPATYNLGACFESEGRLADAETAYQQVLKFDPNHADAKAGLDRLAKARKSK